MHCVVAKFRTAVVDGVQEMTFDVGDPAAAAAGTIAPPHLSRFS